MKKGVFFVISNIEDVIMFASVAHKNQKMYDPDVPYLTHVFGVSSNVLEAYYNGEEEFDLNYALKVSILHDTIEDTSVTYDDICLKYGKDIADGVLALSKDEHVNKQEQMMDCIRRIKECKKEVAIVKLADRTFNMRSRPSGWSKEHCEKYLREAILIKNELGMYSHYLDNKLELRIKEY